MIMCQHRLQAAYSAALVVRMQVQGRLLAFWPAAGSNCNAASQTTDMCVSFVLDQTLHLPNLPQRYKLMQSAIGITASALGSKSVTVAPAGIDSPTAYIQQEGATELHFFCISTVL